MLRAPMDYFGEMEEYYYKQDSSIFYKERSFIRQVTFQVTDDCNLKCTYCYQGNKHHNRMSFDTAKAFIDFMFDAYYNDPDNVFFYKEKAAGMVIEFIGGEPLLEADLIYKIIEYFESQLYLHPDCNWNLFHRYTICSNGVLYFKDNVQKLLTDFESLISYSVTVDGTKEYHDKCRLFPNGAGSYDMAIAAALDWKKRTTQDATKITIAPDNIQYIYDAVVNLYNLGFPRIFLNCVYEDVWGSTEEERRKIAHDLYVQAKRIANWIIDNHLENKIYLRIFDDNCRYQYVKDDLGFLKKNTCGADSNMISIDYKGDLFPCIRFMNSSLNGEQPEFVIGNVSHGIGYTEDEKQRLNDLKELTLEKSYSQECLNCCYCKGCLGCAGYNYQKFGTVFQRATYFCYTEYALGLASYYFNKKLSLKDAPNTTLPNDKILHKILLDSEIQELKSL